MANIKVSELTTATQFNDEDYAMIVQNNGNKKITKESMFNSIYDELYYKDGDTFVLTDFLVMAGQLTGGNKSLNFTLPTPKSMKNITRITVGDLYINIRKPAGGYIATNINFNSSDYTLTLTKSSDNMLRIIIVSSTNFDTVNNQPVSGDIASGTTFTFYEV